VTTGHRESDARTRETTPEINQGEEQMGGDEIELTAMEPHVFGVQITEGDQTTSHRIKVSADVLDLVQVDDDDVETEEIIVRETIKFLLEREPATEISRTFSLDEVATTFPEYSDEIVSRVGAPS
jgi:hypothetical protein